MDCGDIKSARLHVQAAKYITSVHLATWLKPLCFSTTVPASHLCFDDLAAEHLQMTFLNSMAAKPRGLHTKTWPSWAKAVELKMRASHANHVLKEMRCG